MVSITVNVFNSGDDLTLEVFLKSFQGGNLLVNFILVRSVFLIVTSASVFNVGKVLLSNSEDLLGLIDKTSELT